MTSKTFRQPDGTVQTTVTAAGFNETVQGANDFRDTTWVTATFYRNSKTLSAFGYACGVDHHLTVTELDISDEKRLAEVVMTLGITREAIVWRTLRTERFYYCFTRPYLTV